MAKIVVWLSKSKAAVDFEGQFVEDILLSKVAREATLYGSENATRSDSPIVIVNHDEEKIPMEFADFVSRLRGHILVHLSGESLHDSTQLYSNAATVLRSYYDPRIQAPNVFAVPLGFKSGFLNVGTDVKLNHERELVWFFAGEMKSHRARMISALRGLLPNYVLVTEGWNSAAGLSVEEMKNYFGRAIFAPCPFGKIHPDSFRVMEALENGCIPVTVEFLGRDYFQYIYGDHPFVVGKNWSDAARKIRELMRHPDMLIERRARVLAWYVDFKDRLSEDVKSIVDGRYDQLLSEQFKYQVDGRNAKNWKRKFDWHFDPKSDIWKFADRLLRRMGL